MSENGDNGAVRVSEFDIVADLRREIDDDLRAVSRRIGIAETSIRDRLDMVATKVDRLIGGHERILGELKTLADYIVRVLDRTMDVENEVALMKTGVTPLEPKRRKAGKK
jgi:hypothetical protein